MYGILNGFWRCGTVFNAVHISRIVALFAGSMLYCRLYRFFLFIGGTNMPVSRQRSTLGDR